MGNRNQSDKHRFPIAWSIPPDKFKELKTIAEQAQTPDAKLEIFDRLIADGGLPYSKRQFPMRIGGMAARLLREVLNAPAPKTNQQRQLDPLGGVLHSAVDDILRDTRAALKAGSPKSIVDEMVEQTKKHIPLYSSLIGRVEDFNKDLDSARAAAAANLSDEEAYQKAMLKPEPPEVPTDEQIDAAAKQVVEAQAAVITPTDEQVQLAELPVQDSETLSAESTS